MKFATAGFLVMVACASQKAREPAMSSTTPTPRACPLGVQGAVVAVDETELGVALTFSGAEYLRDELRARARDAAAMYGPGRHRGQGHDGLHGYGGHHGVGAMYLPASLATVEDVEDGARIVLVPIDPGQRDVLVLRAREEARRLNTTTCR